MKFALLPVVLAGAGCGPATPATSQPQPSLGSGPLDAAPAASPPAGSNTRFCVEIVDGEETRIDCQPTAARCEDYALFLEQEGWIVEAGGRCESRVVVCVGYTTSAGPEELCGRDLGDCELGRSELERWEEVLPGSLGDCR